MTPNPRIFWDVDTQVDFLHPSGKLYVRGSESIVPALARLTQWAAARGVLIVASADAHLDSDAELLEWPPHCLIGTPGQEKIPETLLPHPLVLPNHRVPIPADLSGRRQVILEKQQLDVFTNPNTAPLVDQLGCPEVVLYGVVTELCVAHAARNLLARGCRVTLVEDAMAALDPAQARALLDGFVRQGARIARTEEIVGP